MSRYSSEQVETKVRDCQAGGWRSRLDLKHPAATDDDIRQLCGEDGVQALAELDLGGSEVTSAALPDVAKLKQLTWLDLANTAIDGPALAHLTGLRLKSLVLANDPIMSQDVAHLSKLTTLTNLDLTSTNIDDSSLGHLLTLTQLADLSVIDCDLLHDLSPLEKLLPPGGSLRELHIRDSAGLDLPDALLRETDAAKIFDQIRALRSAEKRRLLQVKLVLLGEGRVGKSDLAARLTSNGENLGSGITTHDFDIHELTMDVKAGNETHAVKCRMFDFGGQPELHSSHRFFLQSRRVVYVLVLNSLLGQDETGNRCDYWLRLIKRQGADAPVVVVFTHADRPGLKRLAAARVQSLAGEIGVNVKAVIDGYCNRKSEDLTTIGIADRYRDVGDAVRSAIASMQYVFEPNYTAGFLRLMEFAEGNARPDDLPNSSVPARNYKYFEKRDFDLAADWLGKSDKSMAKLKDLWFAELRDLGCFHYVGDADVVKQQRNPHRVGDVCFNPRWVKSPVYDVIRSAPLRTDLPSGVVSEDELRLFIRDQQLHAASDSRRNGELWGQVPFDNGKDVDLLIELMRACELLFDASDRAEQRFMVPDRLVRELAPLEDFRPDEIRPPFAYDFLPESALLRFIGRWYGNILHNRVCKNEVKVGHSACGTAVARVRADVTARTITIALFGRNQLERSRLFDLIADEMERIEPCANKEAATAQPSLKRDQWAVIWYEWAATNIPGFDKMTISGQYRCIEQSVKHHQDAANLPDIGSEASWEKSSRKARQSRRHSRRGRTGRSTGNAETI
jgi:hypothetical protein